MSDSLWIDEASSANPVACQMLARHPKVRRVSTGAASGISFCVGDWHREVTVGETGAPLYGLVESIDNNPLVCADGLSVPGNLATLGLIALAPLVRAGLLDDGPAVTTNCSGDERELASALESSGWPGGVATHVEPLDLGTVLVATAMAAIRTPEDLHEVTDLYDEHFGRSFYVRHDHTSEWGPSLVSGKPYAVYRLRIAQDDPVSLLTIQVMADRNGKCGAAQWIHAMNVMCGFEESLGLG